jgi:hypothetical protein
MQTLSARHKLVQSFRPGTSRLYRGCFIRTTRSSASVSVPTTLQYIITGSARLLTSTLIRAEGANELGVDVGSTHRHKTNLRHETKLSRESDPLSRAKNLDGSAIYVMKRMRKTEGVVPLRQQPWAVSPGKYSLHGTGAGPTPLFARPFPIRQEVLGGWITVVPKLPPSQKRRA